MTAVQAVRRFYGGRRARGPERSAWVLRVWITGVVLAYLALVVAGVTTSSIGVGGLLDDPTTPAPGLIAGGPDPIRSDEFLRATPWRLGQLSSDGADLATPLTFQDTAVVASSVQGFFTAVIYPDTWLLAKGGDHLVEQRFAAAWWLPVALVLALLPMWLAQMGVRQRVAIPTTLLVTLAPVSVWWSWGTINILCWAVLAAVLSVAALRRRVGWRRLLTVLSLVAAGVALARLGLSYLLWAIPLGAGILLPTGASLLARAGERRRALGVIGSAVLVAGVAFGGFLNEHRASIEVLSSTVYPGSRRAVGDSQNLAQLFSAPHLWVLQQSPAVAGTNYSEVSTGFLVLVLAALVLVPSIRWRQVGRVAVPAITALVVVGLLALWCTITWPLWAGDIPILDLVTPSRVAQVLGLLGTIAFGLVMGAWAETSGSGRRPAAVTAGVVTFFVTAMAGSVLRGAFIPSYQIRWIWAVSLLTGAAVGIGIACIDRRWGLVPLAVLALPVVALVNPWQQGFADLQAGTTAAQIDRLSSGSGLWASDDIWVDAVLMANAHRAVSGQQWGGPDRSAWEVLDPTDKYESEWNRGAAYLVFSWAPSGQPVTIKATSPDYIVITADPCDSRLRDLGITRIVSAHTLKNACLVQTSTFNFGGRGHWTYDVRS